MILPRSTATLAALRGGPTLTVLDSTGSTNDDLRLVVQEAGSSAPDFVTIVTGHQTGGRGRLGRPWVAPAGQSLAVSVLVRPTDDAGRSLPPEALGWFPLLAGLAMSESVAALLPDHHVGLKWPNDVLVGAAPTGRKVCGILTELEPTGRGPVLLVGAGLNLAIPADRLPTPTSTSLTLEGAAGDTGRLADAACSVYLATLQHLCAAFGHAGGDPRRSGIRQHALARLDTLGRRVRVTVQGRPPVIGEAVDLDDAGRIVVRADREPGVQAVAAGDIEHLRYE